MENKDHPCIPSSPYYGDFPTPLEGMAVTFEEAGFQCEWAKDKTLVKFTDDSILKIKRWWGLGKRYGLAQLRFDWVDNDTAIQVACIFPDSELQDEVAKATLKV